MGRPALSLARLAAAPRTAPPRGGHRRDIQALRALAVACVLAFHLWPAAAPGGYVGVDVFFVVSGFLITGLLWREVDRTGRVRLAEFWARRARRLLPAALLVLATTAALTLVFQPATRWAGTAKEIAASAFYVENWVLASDAVDYLASDTAASPVQHYWSLSVEEQFYLVWPVLVVAVVLLARRRARAWFVAVAAVATVASFAWSVHLTADLPAAAYFVTPTRAWEFAVGGLAALAPALTLGARARGLLAWAGVALILLATFTFAPSTPFPGWHAAIPVAGALAILLARADGPWSPMVAGGRRPVQRLGDLSYSVYLWHWPLLILAGAALGRAPGTLELLAILAATVLLAEGTYRWVEQPVRHATALTGRRPAWTLAGALVASGAVVALAFAITGAAHRESREAARIDAAAEQTVTEGGCFGADALAHGGDCVDPSLDGVLLPSALTAHDDGVRTCMQDQTTGAVRVCESGVAPGEARATVAVIGDSHTVHWLPAVRLVAQEQGWHLLEIAKESCPFADATRASEPAMADSCDRWNAAVHRYLGEHPEITRIITSGSSRNEFVPAPGSTSLAIGEAGYIAAWERVPDSVTRIDAIRDAPRPRPDVVDCVAALPSAEAAAGATACGLPAGDALLPDPLADAARAAGGRVALADLSDLFCTADACDPVVGHAMLYRDGHHLTATYAESLAPYLAQRMGLSGAAEVG
ncbi:acyltransferase family protein [Demequina silvatica]|uniref:acyltransferase family protein n=1 Tax=Demequina silvatica TaxID=1638988 RepID=UPI0007859683|nr:acyltransferase family protein [Demequina silvatica]